MLCQKECYAENKYKLSGHNNPVVRNVRYRLATVVSYVCSPFSGEHRLEPILQCHCIRTAT